MPLPWDRSGAAGPQAGWYQDPSGNPQPRWWDGSQWTGRVTTEPSYSVTPPEPAPPARSMPLSAALTYPDEYRDGKPPQYPQGYGRQYPQDERSSTTRSRTNSP
jgi:Protein of unknown function (DUF2510)